MLAIRARARRRPRQRPPAHRRRAPPSSCARVAVATVVAPDVPGGRRTRPRSRVSVHGARGAGSRRRRIAPRASLAPPDRRSPALVVTASWRLRGGRCAGGLPEPDLRDRARASPVRCRRPSRRCRRRRGRGRSTATWPPLDAVDVIVAQINANLVDVPLWQTGAPAVADLRAIGAAYTAASADLRTAIATGDRRGDPGRRSLRSRRRGTSHRASAIRLHAGAAQGPELLTPRRGRRSGRPGP